MSLGFFLKPALFKTVEDLLVSVREVVWKSFDSETCDKSSGISRIVEDMSAFCTLGHLILGQRNYLQLSTEEWG